MYRISGHKSGTDTRAGTEARPYHRRARRPFCAGHVRKCPVFLTVCTLGGSCPYTVHRRSIVRLLHLPHAARAANPLGHLRGTGCSNPFSNYRKRRDSPPARPIQNPKSPIQNQLTAPSDSPTMQVNGWGLSSLPSVQSSILPGASCASSSFAPTPTTK